jgi:hypothetical protein
MTVIIIQKSRPGPRPERHEQRVTPAQTFSTSCVPLPLLNNAEYLNKARAAAENGQRPTAKCGTLASCNPRSGQTKKRKQRENLQISTGGRRFSTPRRVGEGKITWTRSLAELYKLIHLESIRKRKC